ncbi:SAV_6107 family HEPN domain-containing protein [Streptomyces sp. NRRL F-5053]|nr:SAV_6107 family HEPN domain-containing protein [Streptomyces sp. NRRL F-5053]
MMHPSCSPGPFPAPGPHSPPGPPGPHTSPAAREPHASSAAPEPARPQRGSRAADVHPVLRRATAPPAALDLLAQAQHGLDEAMALQAPNERYATAHLAALRTAAAVLAVRGRPEPPPRRRTGPGRRPRRPAIRSAWEVLPEVAPELAEWSALFASGARRRERAEAGIEGAADRRQADELIRHVEMFLRLAERMLVTQPALPRPRTAGEEPPLGPDRRAG